MAEVTVLRCLLDIKSIGHQKSPLLHNRKRSFIRTFLFVFVSLWILGPIQAHAGWELTFSDEFSQGPLDRTKWKTSDYWGNRVYTSNKEEQCYTDDAFSFDNGDLVIRAQPRTFQSCRGTSIPSYLRYSSGMITTAGCNTWETGAHCTNLKRFNQRYGYFEMRAKLPKGRGLWPAFWLLPANGSWPPEIDVMEFLGHESNNIHMTYHWSDLNDSRHRTSSRSYSGPDFTQAFHTFGVDWQPGLLIWYVDGVERHRTTGNHVPSVPMYILANLAVGGSWPGSPDAATSFPADMKIDYIRAYRRVSDGRPDSLPPTSGSNGSMTLKGISEGQTVSGRIYSQVEVSGLSGVSRVEFYVGSRLVTTERNAPYFLGGDAGSTGKGWDTRQVPNGRTTFRAVVYYSGGTRTVTRNITIQNQTGTVTLKGISEGQTVRGRIYSQVEVSGLSGVSRVEFYVGSRLVTTERNAPYFLGGDAGSTGKGWDTRQVANGRTSFKIVVHYSGGTRTMTRNITIAN